MVSTLEKTKNPQTRLEDIYGEAKAKEYIERVDLHCKATGKVYRDKLAMVELWLKQDKVPKSEYLKEPEIWPGEKHHHINTLGRLLHQHGMDIDKINKLPNNLFNKMICVETFNINKYKTPGQKTGGS